MLVPTCAASFATSIKSILVETPVAVSPMSQMPQQIHNEHQVSGRARFASRPSAWIAQTFRQLDTNSLLALVDQAIVSAMSLIASIIVGRYCGANGLGIYSLAISFVVLMVGFHTAIVSAPYTVFRTRIDSADEKSFAGSSMVSSAIVILLGSTLLLIGFGVFYVFEIIPSILFRAPNPP